MKKIIIFLSIFFFNAHIFASDFEFKLYNIDDGLNANFINDLTVDNNENIWLGTNMGLKKFDGYNFINFEIPHYNRKEIRKLFYQNEQLYILYKGGDLILLNLYDGTSKKYTYEKILDFFVTPEKTFLLKSNFNIEIIEKNKRIKYTLQFSKKIPTQDSESFQAIISYKNCIYFTIPRMGLFKMKKNKIENLSTCIDDTPGGFRERFKILNSKVFFIGLQKPILVEDHLTLIDLLHKKNYNVNDLAIKNNIKYYIRNDNSLIIDSNGKTKTIIDKLKNIELRKIFFCGKNTFIISNKGLYKIILKNHYFKNFNLDNNLSVKRKIIENENETLFFGFPNIISVKDGKIKKLNHSRVYTYDVVKVKDKYYLTTEGKGLAIADDQFKNINPIKNNIFENVICVYYDAFSNLIYYGNNEFLFYFVPGSRDIKKIPNIFKGYSIKAIVSDHKHNRMFVGTEKGIFILNLKNKSTKKFISNKIIGDLLIDEKRNLLYIGHDTGILIYNLSRLSLVKSLSFNFLKNPRVTCLVKDNQNRIWGSTYSGLMAYDYKTNNLLELKNPELLNQEYNYKSACKLKNGDLIFGGLDGYDIITPSKFDFSIPKTSGRITGYHLIKPNDSIYFNRNNPTSIKFKNKNEFLRVYISSTNSINKEKCYFQYKLDNTNWIDLKQEYIDLVGLSKGQYQLNVRGIDNIGKIIKFHPITIIVTEQFYKSDSFVFGLIIILFFLLIFAFQTSYNRLKLKNEIYEKISMDLHDEVGTVLSKTSLLISQNKVLEKDHLEKIQKNIKQANFGLRANINSIKEDDKQLIYLYYECIEVMESFLNIKNISYKYSFTGKNSKKTTKSLYKDLKLCFYEIFNNTIKYSSTDHVDVVFTEKNNMLTILIQEKNNFINFDNLVFGNGLKNIQKRMQRNNGNINFVNDKKQKTYSIIIKIKL